jgi:hypothetical protein
LRAGASNINVINKWFDDLSAIVIELNIGDKPNCIWNLDESPFWPDMTSQYTYAPKGSKSVARVSGNSEHITVVGAASAAGHCLPPFFIFSGKMEPQINLMEHAHPSNIYMNINI